MQPFLEILVPERKKKSNVCYLLHLNTDQKENKQKWYTLHDPLHLSSAFSLFYFILLNTRACYVAHPGLEHSSPASISSVLGLKVYTTMINNYKVPLLRVSFASDT